MGSHFNVAADRHHVMEHALQRRCDRELACGAPTSPPAMRRPSAPVEKSPDTD